MAIQAMNALLSNSHFSKHILRALEHKKIVNKDHVFFKVMASYGCIAADELITRLANGK